PYYYAPGWWEAGAQLSFYVGTKEWENLPKDYQYAIEAASAEAHTYMQARHDALNPGALARLLNNGTKVRFFSRQIVEGRCKAAVQSWEEEAAKHAKCRAIYEPY